MIRIAPSLLSADFAFLAQEISRVERGGADRIHLDVMDGHFVPNITFGPVLVAAARKHTVLPFGVHLMIEAPERYVEAFAESGANYLLVHQEACVHLHRTVQQIRQLGVKPGVAINPATPLTAIEEILPFVDEVLVMTVNPGFGGQEFIESMLDKIARLRTTLDRRGLDVEIGVDGGVGPATVAGVVQAGATVLVAGSSVFGAREGAEAAVRALREAAQAAEPKRKGQP
jgi:ribulose-phosphate 3-epimerase